MDVNAYKIYFQYIHTEGWLYIYRSWFMDPPQHLQKYFKAESQYPFQIEKC